MKITLVHGEPSWKFRHGITDFSITRNGAHLLPSAFRLSSRQTVSPYFVRPWKSSLKSLDGARILKPLRGDFFCLPFGGNQKKHFGQQHQAHGESSYAAWNLRKTKVTGPLLALTLDLTYRQCRGAIEKRITLHEKHSAIYTEHLLDGFKEKINFGHHPNLNIPNDGGPYYLSKSHTLFGEVFPDLENPAQGGYSSLKSGVLFNSLEKVPLHGGGMADLTTYPQSPGYTDLVTLASDPAIPIGWTTLVYPKQRFLWFSLKETRTLSLSVIWIQNGGRHYSPWNGLAGVIGLEETTSLVHGLAESATPNVFTKRGIPTSLRPHKSRPTSVKFVQGVCPIPAGFGKVIKTEISEDKITFTDARGKRASTALWGNFLG